VSDVVQAILGVVQSGGEGAEAEGNGEPTGELEMTEPDERSDDKYDPEQLARGAEVELEHTDNEAEAKKIAKDHLDEDPEYYVKLEKVEGSVEEKKLSPRARKSLPKGEFVFPGERKYPIEDKRHARNALARVSQFGSSSEKAKVRAAVHKRYPDIGKDK
jgi:hypothetical protein